MQTVTKSVLELPRRRRSATKGDYGRVLVVAGSEDYPGAAALCTRACLAALRSGCDYVTLAAPGKVAWAINARTPDIVTKKCAGKRLTTKHAPKIIELARRHDVLCIGSGLGEESRTLASRVITALADMPKVIDADALKAIDLRRVRRAILTPHKMEWQLLCANAKIPEDIKRAQTFLNDNVVLLKGPADHIVSKTRIAKNTTGTPTMAKAGTGDVLAGLCAGLLAQTGDLFKSACAAAYINGKVGEKLEKKMGRTFIASDIIGHLHEVLR